MNYNSRLFTYKLKDDVGFAPNPFGGMLTLATCKPLIRKHKNIGDWVAGFTSKALVKDKNYSPKLIYLMQVTDKVNFEKYWNDKQYEDRKPKKSDIIMEKIGDNIYKPSPSSLEGFEQQQNLYHYDMDIKRDLSGEFVLISTRYYYFGGSPIEIPAEISPKIPKGQSAHGVKGFNDDKKKEDFLSWIESNYAIGIHDKPHTWFQNDETYKLDSKYVGKK